MKNILEKTQHNLILHCQVVPNSRILVGLSGGADSIALLEILLQLGYHCQAAHCNFHLRGEESDRDEAFVRQWCKNKEIPLHVVHFDTQQTARDQGISIEMAARQLRYNWFKTLLEKEQLHYLAIGHHADDSVETFFLNLTRGTGVRGLSGIQYRNGQIIRPLLNLSRAEIETYCRHHNLEYVNDSTNAEEHYLRNKIRHSVVPVLKSINPAFLETMQGNMLRMMEIGELLSETTETFRQQAVAMEDDNLLISKKILQQTTHKRLILFEVLNGFGFNAATIDDLLKCLEEGKIGRQFFSATHRLILDRYNLVLLARDKEEEEKTYYIEQGLVSMIQPIAMTLAEYEKKDQFEPIRPPHIGLFDADLIQFPLTLRHWQEGDQFKPLGLNGFKKLSDYFIDKKIRRDQKEQMWILLSGNDIIWLVGERIDDRYKITAKTKNILEIKLTENNRAPHPHQ
ncbi:MAG: tRNA lysidine(34) synthetase TilS [Breznakibacter sp.]